MALLMQRTIPRIDVAGGVAEEQGHLALVGDPLAFFNATATAAGASAAQQCLEYTQVATQLDTQLNTQVATQLDIESVQTQPPLMGNLECLTADEDLPAHRDLSSAPGFITQPMTQVSLGGFITQPWMTQMSLDDGSDGDGSDAQVQHLSSEPQDYIGRSFTKHFLGRGVFTGTITSYKR
jgi:hypothetical protein